MKNEVKVYTMIETLGMSFPEVAEALGGLTIKEVGLLWAKGENARSRHLAKPKVVFRKRLTTSTKHRKKLVNKMKALKA